MSVEQAKESERLTFHLDRLISDYHHVKRQCVGIDDRAAVVLVTQAHRRASTEQAIADRANKNV